MMSMRFASRRSEFPILPAAMDGIEQWLGIPDIYYLLEAETLAQIGGVNS
jgi:hypothetical protein